MDILLLTEDLAIQRSFHTALETGRDDLLSVCVTTREAEAWLHDHQKPAVVAVDFGTPGLGGLKALGRLIKLAPRTRLILLTHTPSVAVARQALRLGVVACVPASLTPDDLPAILTLVQRPNDVIVLPQGAFETPVKDRLLSRRERQILALLCDGQQNKEIAHTFGIKEVTVKMHMRSVIRKLGARNRTHAAMIARDRGLV
ncbi:response regulator transcription factor [uncultured Aliiroseovarius sp.]|uniref:response regulator transcription factor n=1 Tax=uncultured Aliiroseovarius sp. TaxID=1658783 RepID=UPI00259795D3|nr:response regulator transcription factor [uncultured Aliiroseovarius sp.]